MTTEKEHRILIAMDESKYADYALDCKYKYTFSFSLNDTAH